MSARTGAGFFVLGERIAVQVLTVGEAVGTLAPSRPDVHVERRGTEITELLRDSIRQALSETECPGARILIVLPCFIWLDTICLVSNTGHMESINASDFKARCLAILDRVQTTGTRVVILKRGRPVAELHPASRTHAEYPQWELKGTVIVAGDIVQPAAPEEHWESLES